MLPFALRQESDFFDGLCPSCQCRSCKVVPLKVSYSELLVMHELFDFVDTVVESDTRKLRSRGGTTRNVMFMCSSWLCHEQDGSLYYCISTGLSFRRAPVVTRGRRDVVL